MSEFVAKEVAVVAGLVQATVIKWIETDNFPTAGVDRRWESNNDLIDEYRRRRIEKAGAGEKAVETRAATPAPHPFVTGD
jgi:hypothetical protein